MTVLSGKKWKSGGVSLHLLLFRLNASILHGVIREVKKAGEKEIPKRGQEAGSVNMKGDGDGVGARVGPII